MSASNESASIVVYEKPSPPLGANRTTILSIGGLSWSAIPRTIRLCKADLERKGFECPIAKEGQSKFNEGKRPHKFLQLLEVEHIDRIEVTSGDGERVT